MKIKITYTEAEKPLFERVRAELIQTIPGKRQHESDAPGGLYIWYMKAERPKEFS